MYSSMSLSIPPFRRRSYGRNRQPRGLQRTWSYQDQLETRSVDVLSDVSEAPSSYLELSPLHGSGSSSSEKLGRTTTPVPNPSNSPWTRNASAEGDLQPVISHLSIGAPALDVPFPAPFPERDDGDDNAPPEMEERDHRPDITLPQIIIGSLFNSPNSSPDSSDSGYAEYDDFPILLVRMGNRSRRGCLTDMEDSWPDVYDEDEDEDAMRTFYEHVIEVDASVDDENQTGPTVAGMGRRSCWRNMKRKIGEKVEAARRFLIGSPEPPKRGGGGFM